MYLSLIDPLKVIEGISIAVMAILGIGWGVAKFWKSKEKTDNFIAIHTEIHELLTELRLSAGSMRATVLQFHNGEYFMDGISMRKFSITHESSHRGYISQAVKFKNVLCSLYIPLLNRILEDKAIIYHVEAMPESYAKHFFEDENISHFSCLPLKNKGINVGFVLMQWHKDFEPILIQEKNFMDIFESIRNSIELQLSHQKN
jgi:hypothetical protein